MSVLIVLATNQSLGSHRVLYGGHLALAFQNQRCLQQVPPKGMLRIPVAQSMILQDWDTCLCKVGYGIEVQPACYDLSCRHERKAGKQLQLSRASHIPDSKRCYLPLDTLGQPPMAAYDPRAPHPKLRLKLGVVDPVPRRYHSTSAQVNGPTA